MFGGLEIKGSDKKKEDSSASSKPAATTTTSAFAFLSGQSATSAESSGFDYFNNAKSKDIPDKKNTPEVSAFSFLHSQDEQPKSINAPIGNTSSTQEKTTISPAVSHVPANHEETASSGFSFLTGSDTMSSMSRDESVDEYDFLSTSNSTQHVGSGIVFGGATKKTATSKKKRTRTAKIGTAAMDGIPPRPPPPEPTIVKETSHVSTTEQALEANQRAEGFIQEKLQQEQHYEQETEIPAIRPSNSEDERIVAEARAAAEEAQRMNKPSILGGLFRPRQSHGTSSSSNHGSVSRPPQPTRLEPSQSEGSYSGVQRLQHEQEETKRAISERHFEMLQHTKEESTHQEERSFSPPQVDAASPKVFAPPPPDVLSSPSPKTPTDVFEDMLKEFRQQVVRSMAEVTRLRQHRSGLLEERFLTMAKERLATQQKAAAEAQQTAAAETEDFDLADRMGHVIDTHERELHEYASVLENISRALDQLEQQKKQVVEQVKKCFRDVQVKLKKFQEEQQASETENTTEALKRFEAVSQHLSSEHERLQQDLKHIERDSQLVAEERKEVEEAIAEQAGQFTVLRDEARNKLKTVEEEIEDLRKQLAAKLDVAASLRTEVAGHEEAVLKVRVKFSRQLNRVKTKEQTVEDNRMDWELEKKSYEKQKAEHDEQVRAHSEALLARDSLLNDLKREIDMSDSFESIIATEIGFEVLPEGSESDNGTASLQADVVSVEAALSEAKEILKVAKNTVMTLEKEQTYLLSRIPELEEIKSKAAANRDFKAAGKASKEIKEANARLVACQEELAGDIIEKKTAAEVEVARLEKELEEKRKVSNEKERESALKAMQDLAENIKRLVAVKKSVCGDEHGNSVQGVGAYCIDQQINAIMLEGQTFGDKYGGWDELMRDIGFSNGDDSNMAQPTFVGQNNNDFDTHDENTDTSPSDNENAGTSTETETKADKMKRFRDLTLLIEEYEQGIQLAAENEEFDKAAEIDEKLQTLLLEVQSIDLTDEEMEAAFAKGEQLEEHLTRTHDSKSDAEEVVEAEGKAKGEDISDQEAEVIAKGEEVHVSDHAQITEHEGSNPEFGDLAEQGESQRNIHAESDEILPEIHQIDEKGDDESAPMVAEDSKDIDDDTPTAAESDNMRDGNNTD